MTAWKPYVPFNVPMEILTPIERKINGVLVKCYSEDGRKFLGSLRTFGGTEHERDGLLYLEDTAVVNAWYHPDFKPNCRVRVLTDGSEWNIIGTPENIGMRNQWIEFRIRRTVGGA